MAEKFDLIAKVEEGANPIFGLAAPAEGSGVTPAQMEAQALHRWWRKGVYLKRHKTTPPVPLRLRQLPS